MEATVGIGPRSEGGFGLEVAPDVELSGPGPDDAGKLVDEAHQVRSYPNATRNNIDVKLSLK